MSAPHGRGWFDYGLSVLLHAVLFAVVGPLVGAFVFGGVAMAIVAKDASSGILGLLFIALSAAFSIPFAYLVGFASAAVTGAITAVASSVLSEGWLYAFAAVVGALAALGFSPGDVERPAHYSTALAAAGAVAAVLCTLLCSGIRLRPPRATGLPPQP